MATKNLFLVSSHVESYHFQELYNNNQIDDNLPKNFSAEKKQKEIGKRSL